MANTNPPKYKEYLLQHLTTDTVKAVLLRGYTYSAAHVYLGDISSGQRIAVSAALSSKTVTNGTFSSSAAVFTAVTAGAACEAIRLFIDTGDPATSRLLPYFDTLIGLPVEPNGGDITVSWPGGSSGGWFTL